MSERERQTLVAVTSFIFTYFFLAPFILYAL